MGAEMFYWLPAADFDGESVPDFDETWGVEHEEIFSEVRRMVDELPPKYAQAIRLRYHDGLLVREIADVLGISENAAEIRVRRGLKMIKESAEKIR